MSSFTKPLTVTKVNKRKWKIERSFTYFIGDENSDGEIRVPKGFITDFASIPRVFWTILPPDGKYTQAAVLHDFLYYKKGKLTNMKLSRKECDGVFLEAMEVLSVSWIKRHTIYRAVRMFGWLPFKRIIKLD